MQAVIFDLDGLMLDTEAIAKIAWQKAGTELGYTITDEIFASFIGRTAVDSSAMLEARWGPGFPVEHMRNRITVHWENHIAVNEIPKKPGLYELLDFLDTTGLKKGIATSSRRDNAHNKLGPLTARFDCIVTGDDVTRGKPAPDIFLLAAKGLGVSPGECVVLEDSLAGIQGAKAAGMTAIMVPDLVSPNDTVDHVCVSLHDVPAWLQARGISSR